MDVRWSKGCAIPTSESSHVQPLTSYNFTSGVSYACRNICTSLEQPFKGLSPWRDVMCDTLCMLGEAAV